jgi:DNA-binding transcriptional LysR family regulator
MPLDLRLVRYFVAVAQEGSVTRAAERLHLAQPSLSAAVKQLEGQLGVALVERSGRGIALTPAGELLLRRGAELVALADAVEGEVRDRGAAPAARLRLGLSPTARYGVGPALLAACAAKAPAVMLPRRPGRRDRPGRRRPRVRRLHRPRPGRVRGGRRDACDAP